MWIPFTVGTFHNIEIIPLMERQPRLTKLCIVLGFLGVSVVKNSAANARDVDLMPWLGGCPGEGNGNPLQ